MSRLTLGIVLLALAAAAAFFGLRPEWQQAQSLRAEIAKLQSLHEELLSLAERREALRSEYNAIPEPDLEKLKAMLPAEPGTAAVLGDFEALAQGHGLVLERVEFSTAEPAASGLALVGRRYAALPFTLALRGSYEGFRAFLGSLESNLRLADVREVNFGSGQGASLTVTLKGRIYHLR